MTNKLLKPIKEMHIKFGIPCEKLEMSKKEKEFRIAGMQEELNEYRDAHNEEEQLDALIDVIVFALTAVERHGYLDIFEEGFDRVMSANLKKELGGNDKRDNFQLDLVKPKGWEAPKLEDLIDRVKNKKQCKNCGNCKV